MPGKNYQPGGLAIWAEAPGADEDRTGLPMLGRAGKLLDSCLAQAGLSRDDVLILNRVRCRPPRNRIQDYPDALIACDEWSEKELDIYNPSVAVLAGNTAMRAVLGPSVNITAVRGTCRQTSEDFAYGKRIYIPTFHPAAALRNPELTADIINDLRLAKELL